MGATKLHSAFLLWLGAAISIAEIVTGTLVAPLGLTRGLLAIILGHLIGGGLFLLPAAYLSAKTGKTAIATTTLVFGKTGEWLFSALNALQLLGWTAVMLVNAQQALNGLTAKLFGWQSVIGMTLIVAVLIVIWLLLNHDWLFRVNNLIVGLLAIGAVILLWTVIHVAPLTKQPVLTPLSFGSALELNITMALSWLPLIGDYTKQAKHPWLMSLASVSGYVSGSCSMFILGLLTVVLTHRTDFASVLTQSQLGLLALLIIVFSTVTTTFMDAYSAATNLKNIWSRLPVNATAIVITLLGTGVAVWGSLAYYENFLTLIGAVFAPLFIIIFISYFVFHGRLPIGFNFGWWLLGSFGYQWLTQQNLPIGATLTLLLVLGLGVLITGYFVPRTGF